jgi:hypothetical protein
MVVSVVGALPRDGTTRAEGAPRLARDPGPDTIRRE